MKTSKLYSAESRKIMRIDLQSRRDTTNYNHRRAGITYIQHKTTRKTFRKGAWGKVIIEHDNKPYPHSSTRQQARYARQIAAGQLRMDGVNG